MVEQAGIGNERLDNIILLTEFLSVL